MSLTVGELFAGIAGFGLGFERAGITSSWAVEIDPACRRVLRHHWPDLLIHDDVKTAGIHNLPRVDIITAGVPCQDVSVAGKRAGLAGARTGLFWEAVRIVAELRPTFFVLENVPGLLSSNRGRDFGIILDALAELRALDIAWRILDSQYFGVAQRRRRVFVVADFGGERASEILALSEGMSGHPAPRRTPGQGIAGTLGGGAGERGWEPDTDRMTFVPTYWDGGQVADTLDVSSLVKGQMMPEKRRFPVVTHTLSSNGGACPERSERDASEDGTGRGTPLVAMVFDQKRSVTGHGDLGMSYEASGALGTTKTPAVAFQQNQRDEVRDLGDLAGALSSQPGMKQQNYVAAFAERTRADGRNFEAQEELAYALTNPGSGGRTHSRQIAAGTSVRRLTPTECARLQSFPDSWLDLDPPLSDSTKYRMLGNAVTVNVAEWIGRLIVEAAR